MTKLTNFLTSVLLLWPLLAQGATYHVGTDGNDSRSCTTAQTDSPSTRKRTIQNAINNCWRNPGDILDIRGGDYPEQLHSSLGTNWPAGGTSWSNAMTIRGHAGETVRINPSVSIDNYNIIYFDEGNASGPPNYIIFDNLTIDGGNMTVSLSISLVKFSDNDDLRRVGHIRVQNSKIINSLVTCSGAYPGCGYGNGILSNAYANEYLNNEFYGMSGYPFYITGAGNLIDGNYMHNNDAYIVHLYHGGSPYVPLVDDNIVRNNIIINNGAGNRNPVGSCAILASSGARGQVYNNLIVNQTDPFGAGCGIQLYPSRPPENWVFYNNTIVGNQGACIDIQGGSGSDIRNNICFGNGQDIINSGSGGATITANNPNARNPRFVDPPNANYRLQTSSPRSDALDAAQNLSGTFTGDITSPTTGLVRPATGNWDQGAYEMEVSGGGGPTSPPSKGTFFLAPGGTTTTDCDAAKGAVGSPSAAPFGTYATARVCMLAGSTLYFRAGTYPPLDSGSTPFSGGSPADGPTTLAAYPGETVTLQATGGSPVVFLHNSTTDHFLILQGLILDGLNINGTNGFAGYPGINDIRLDNVEIKNTYYEGVYLEQTSNVEMRNNTRVHNSAVASVGVIGLNRTTNTTITGSEVYASGGPGISSYGGNSNLIIEKSTIRNTPSGKGIILGNASTPDSGVRIANNLIYTNTHGIHLQNGTSNVGLYYNTLWNNSVACMLFDSGVTVSEAINNVCWQVATVTNNAGSGMALTTNQCTGPTGCTAGDPLFASVTPGDVNFLHLCGAAGAPVGGCTGKSPAVDTGTPIASLTSDYASKARPDGVQVDKGAFEEAPVPVPPAQVGLAPVYRTTHFLTLLP